MIRNIALYGQSGTGKTTVADYLVEKYGFVRCATGAACRQVCRILFDSESKTLLNQVTDALREIDENVWLRNALSGARDGSPIVFDSMRFASDYHYLTKLGFSKWKITSPAETRLLRLESRGQDFNPVVDDTHRGETELAQYDFDAIIDNSGSNLPVLYQAVEEHLNPPLKGA